MIQEIIGKRAAIVWQNEAREPSTQPVLLTAYSGEIELGQNGNHITISHEHLEEVIKAALTVKELLK